MEPHFQRPDSSVWTCLGDLTTQCACHRKSPFCRSLSNRPGLKPRGHLLLPHPPWPTATCSTPQAPSDLFLSSLPCPSPCHFLFRPRQQAPPGHSSCPWVQVSWPPTHLSPRAPEGPLENAKLTAPSLSLGALPRTNCAAPDKSLTLPVPQFPYLYLIFPLPVLSSSWGCGENSKA